MNMDFQEKNWPKLDGRASNPYKQLHEWFSKIFLFLLKLSDRMTQLESKEDEKKSEINKMRNQIWKHRKKRQVLVTTGFK